MWKTPEKCGKLQKNVGNMWETCGKHVGNMWETTPKMWKTLWICKYANM